MHGGTLHALVCSAGTSNPKEFFHTTAQDFMQLLQLNIVGCRNAFCTCNPSTVWWSKNPYVPVCILTVQPFLTTSLRLQ